MGCSKPTDPSRATESFSGVLEVGGTNEHDFVVQQYGLVEITLTSLAPDASVLVQLGIGEPTAAGCVLDVVGNVHVASQAQLTGNATPGSWCVSVADAGYLTAPATYAVSVTHP